MHRRGFLALFPAPFVARFFPRSASARLGSGTYRYTYSFVTAKGEPLPSPLAMVPILVMPIPGLSKIGEVTLHGFFDDNATSEVEPHACTSLQ